jgi:anti-sigma regulatory factor (Ser/Thr protein kinase)
LSGHLPNKAVTIRPKVWYGVAMDATGDTTVIDIFDVDKTDEDKRQQIRNIIDSYHHDWDVLAELCQNAVDAIREKNSPKSEIQVRFDRRSKTIEVSDTGPGMSRHKAERALAPNITYKKGQPRLIGEKGLGLTFCAFRANKVTIETSTGDGFVHTVVFEGGRDWLDERKTERPKVVANSKKQAGGSYTKVSAHDVVADFTLEEPRLRHLLLTKTALGSTFPLWPELEKKNPNTEISLSIVETSGAEKTEKLVHCYWHPADHLLHKKSLSEVRELAQNNKMRDFKGWGLTDKRDVLLAGKSAYFYTLMLSVPEYDKLAEQYSLLPRYKLRQREAERSGGELYRADARTGDLSLNARHAHRHSLAVPHRNYRGWLLEQFLLLGRGRLAEFRRRTEGRPRPNAGGDQARVQEHLGRDASVEDKVHRPRGRGHSRPVCRSAEVAIAARKGSEVSRPWPREGSVCERAAE